MIIPSFIHPESSDDIGWEEWVESQVVWVSGDGWSLYCSWEEFDDIQHCFLVLLKKEKVNGALITFLYVLSTPEFITKHWILFKCFLDTMAPQEDEGLSLHWTIIIPMYPSCASLSGVDPSNASTPSPLCNLSQKPYPNPTIIHHGHSILKTDSTRVLSKASNSEDQISELLETVDWDRGDRMTSKTNNGRGSRQVNERIGASSITPTSPMSCGVRDLQGWYKIKKKNKKKQTLKVGFAKLLQHLLFSFFFFLIQVLWGLMNLNKFTSGCWDNFSRHDFNLISLKKKVWYLSYKETNMDFFCPTHTVRS